MNLQPDSKEIRKRWNCGRTCENCDFDRHCNHCGIDFCGCFRYENEGYKKGWKHDKNIDIMCPICAEINEDSNPR